MNKLYMCFCILLFAITGLAQDPCINGMAGIYPCNKVDLLSFTCISDLGGTSEANDLWGWTDPVTKKEYALLGMTNGTSFIDVSDPVNPEYLGILPTQSFNSSWRDIKVVNDFAYIGSEAGGHGIQFFDLKRLRTVVNPPMTFTADRVFSDLGAGNSHNVVALEESNHIVAVGVAGTGGCNGGLIFIDVTDPLNPIRKGCFSEKYAHDAVCFTYRGPDTQYAGKDICIAFNGSNGGLNKITIIDADDTNNPTKIGDFDYPVWRYAHQGWVTDDHKYIILNDELDEIQDAGIKKTRTYVLDITNLDAPALVDFYEADFGSIDHNLYVKGQYAYQANYRAGFRMLDVTNLTTADFSEVAFFDTYPLNDNSSFNSAWTAYPYFESGNVLISDIEKGLFVVKPQVPHFVLTSEKLPKIAGPGTDITFDISSKALAGYTDQVSLSVEHNIPNATFTFGTNNISPDGSTTLTIGNTENLSGPYHLIIKGRGPSNNVVHDFSVTFNVVSRIYVNQNAPANGDGGSWGSGYTSLQEALANVPSSGGEIWVAAGRYFPTNMPDRNASFTIPYQTALYGGFVGTETSLSDRNVQAFTTILSGNLGNINSSDDNAYHVVQTTETGSSILDGFVIEDGNANGVNQNQGGGLLIKNDVFELRNCVFRDNFAVSGSAIYNKCEDFKMSDCVILGSEEDMIVTETSTIQINGEVVILSN